MNLPPLNTPIAHDGSPECPVHEITRVLPVWNDTGEDRRDWPAGALDWTFIKSYTIIVRAPADRIAELEAENARWRENLRGSFEAMCAMRNDLNEMFPMPSLESDLLQGPEATVFCTAVVNAVAAERRRLLRLIDAAVNGPWYPAHLDEARAALKGASHV